jgi:diguanylate cyclase (GGDEF)-like protein
MTGLWNRNAIYDVVTDALDTVGGPGIGVVYLDLDRFKPVNDRYGHAAGDRVLATIADRLDAVCPEEGRVGRFGGDEFVAVFPAADLDEVERVAHRLAASVVDPVELRSGETVTVGVSTGSAFAEPGTTTADELIELADDHLYRIKRARPATR